MSARGMFWRVALFNVPFILLLAAVSHLPDFLKVLAAGAVVLLVPGLAWNDAAHRTD